MLSSVESQVERRKSLKMKIAMGVKKRRRKNLRRSKLRQLKLHHLQLLEEEICFRYWSWIRVLHLHHKRLFLIKCW